MRTTSLILLIACIHLIFTGCAHKKVIAVDKKNCLTDLMEKSITVDTVKNESVQDELKLTGKVTFDEEKVIKVYPVVSGIVTNVKVGLGDRVTKGQILAVIKSTEMAGVENDVNIARSDYKIALKNFSASDDMFKSGVASGKEYLTSKEELQKAKSVLEKATNISSIYGDSSKAFYVKSPIDGVIVSKSINTNLQIRPDYNDNLFTISDLKSLWVMANVFESDIYKVKKDYEVEVTTLTYPDKLIKGKVDRIYDVLDDVTKVMKVRIKLDNSNYQLKAGMFANVTLHYSEDIKKEAISSKSIIFDNSKNYVIVYRSKCDFEIREINIYRSVDGVTYIESGLNAGERVVVKNNLLIYDQFTD